jgi:hypothetical protein
MYLTDEYYRISDFRRGVAQTDVVITGCDYTLLHLSVNEKWQQTNEPQRWTQQTTFCALWSSTAYYSRRTAVSGL